MKMSIMLIGSNQISVKTLQFLDLFISNDYIIYLEKTMFDALLDYDKALVNTNNERIKSWSFIDEDADCCIGEYAEFINLLVTHTNIDKVKISARKNMSFIRKRRFSDSFSQIFTYQSELVELSVAKILNIGKLLYISEETPLKLFDPEMQLMLRRSKENFLEFDGIEFMDCSELYYYTYKFRNTIKLNKEFSMWFFGKENMDSFRICIHKTS